MPKKLPPQSSGILLGGIKGVSASTIINSALKVNAAKAKKFYDGYIPTECLKALHCEAQGLEHGYVTLTLIVRDGRLSRYTVNKEISHIPGDSGGAYA